MFVVYGDVATEVNLIYTVVKVLVENDSQTGHCFIQTNKIVITNKSIKLCTSSLIQVISLSLGTFHMVLWKQF